jgi:Beta/Gamma crystallin
MRWADGCPPVGTDAEEWSIEVSEIIFYVDAGLGGLHTHVFDSTADFTRLALGGVGVGIDGNWNDIVSSFVIVSGTWQCFRDVNFQVPQGGLLGPGSYPFVENLGIDNDSISSVRRIS